MHHPNPGSDSPGRQCVQINVGQRTTVFAVGVGIGLILGPVARSIANRIFHLVLASITAQDTRRELLLDLVRGYIRYGTVVPVKKALWNVLVEPHLLYPHRFVAPTIFGFQLAGDVRDVIQRYIYFFGVWEPNLTYWIAQRLSVGDTFVDVGANIGYYSLLASSRVGGDGRVVSIEASPTTFRLLEGNLARNKAKNVRAVNVAASNHAEVVNIFRSSSDNIGETSMFETPSSELEAEVQAAPLSAILAEAEAKEARLIKIDVEGAEWKVAEGLIPQLASCRDDLEIIVEVDPALLAQRGKQVADLIKIFSDAGFFAYTLDNDYSPLSYLSPPRERPVRVSQIIDWETHLVFSRTDAELL